MFTQGFMCTPCTPELVNKVRVGISFDREVMGALDEQVQASLDLSADRSEIVNSVMRFFFCRDDQEHDNRELATRVREVLISERMRIRNGKTGRSTKEADGNV